MSCKARTLAGAPCSATPVRDDGFCYWHSPAVAAERDAARRRGGENKSNGARARRRLPEGVLTNAELRGVLGVTIADVRAGKIEPAVGSAVASLARAYVAVMESGAVEELGRRLDDLEAAARRGGIA